MKSIQSGEIIFNTTEKSSMKMQDYHVEKYYESLGIKEGLKLMEHERIIQIYEYFCRFTDESKAEYH